MNALRLVAPNYKYVVTADGDGCIRLHAPGGVFIGLLCGHTAPSLGNEADGLWDAAQWLLLAPQDGSGVDDDYWDQHISSHKEWLATVPMKEDILLDFADAAARMGSTEARVFLGDDGNEDHPSEWEARDEYLWAQADAKYDAMQERDL